MGRFSADAHDWADETGRHGAHRRSAHPLVSYFSVMMIPAFVSSPVTRTSTVAPAFETFRRSALWRGEVPAGGNMFMFEIPRGRDAVSAELRANLAAEGWTIDSEEV